MKLKFHEFVYWFAQKKINKFIQEPLKKFFYKFYQFSQIVFLWFFKNCLKKFLQNLLHETLEHSSNIHSICSEHFPRHYSRIFFRYCPTYLLMIPTWVLQTKSTKLIAEFLEKIVQVFLWWVFLLFFQVYIDFFNNSSLINTKNYLKFHSNSSSNSPIN